MAPDVGASSPRSSTYLRGGHPVRRSPRHGAHKRLPPTPTPALEESVARLTVAGAQKKDIATRLHIGREAVNRILAFPHVQEYMAQCREATRAITLSGVADVQTKAMEWLGQTVDEKDPKAFDAVSRGVFSLEKTAASASGESRATVQVAVINAQQESTEVRELIRALTA